MSTTLFVNVDKKISTTLLVEISRIFKQKNVFDVDFCYKGKIIGVDGENYCFDSMWIPLLKPLNDFYGKVDNFKQICSILEAVKDTVLLLLNQEYKINLFLESFEAKKIVFAKCETIKITDINKNQIFKWATNYMVDK